MLSICNLKNNKSRQFQEILTEIHKNRLIIDIDIIYLVFCTTFVMVPHGILTYKLEKQGFEG